MFKVIIFAVVIGIAAAQYRAQYPQYRAQYPQYRAQYQPYQQYSRTGEGAAEIRSFANDINPDGSYHYAYDTSNGISAQEQGVGGRGAQGSFSYVSPEGIPVKVSYTADENGFHPSGTNIHH